jgi:hypothetical protein
VRLLLCFVFILMLAAAGVAQDPLKVAPQAYKLQFENDWVRVIRVYYEPRARLPVHDHTQWAAAYVYLNDSGEIIFRHIGHDGANPITRPPTQTGAFRLYKAIKEVHEVENPGDLPSDFLRVEFKTEAADEKNLRGRYFRELYLPGENYSKVQFENQQVRITRLVCATGKSLAFSPSSEPTLLVAITPIEVQISGKKLTTAGLNLKPGETKWFEARREGQIRNTGNQAAEFLRFDFKTKPSRSGPKVEDRH